MTIRNTIILIIIGLAGAMLLRYAVIQPSHIGLQCVDGSRPFWCWPREFIILVHVWNGWSLSSLFMLMLYVRYQRYCWFALGLLTSCFGMVLYNTGISSLAFLLGLYLWGLRKNETAK